MLFVQWAVLCEYRAAGVVELRAFGASALSPNAVQ